MLVGVGFGPAEALGTYRATVSYARGYALAEATGFTVDASRPAGRERLAALPLSEFPILAGQAGELAKLDADSAFTLGLDALLFGLGGPASGFSSVPLPGSTDPRGCLRRFAAVTEIPPMPTSSSSHRQPLRLFPDVPLTFA